MSRFVVVTGAFGVLGRAVARAFAAGGAAVALVDRTQPSPDVAGEFAAPHVLLGGVDLASEPATVAAMRSAAGALGGIDALVNVAGGFRWQTLADGAVDGWDELYAQNLRTAVVASRSALPWLVRGGAGRIVNVGAGAAARPAAAGMGAYAASKAGVHKLTESLADELKDRGVTVNAVLPGTIDTPRNRADMPDADFARWVRPEAIADVIVFLASPRAHAVTGALVPVTGRG